MSTEPKKDKTPIYYPFPGEDDERERPFFEDEEFDEIDEDYDDQWDEDEFLS